MLLSKVLIYNSGELKKPRILLNATYIHSGLGINLGGKL